MALIDTCANKSFLMLHFAVKIDLVEDVFHLKKVFHLPCDKSVTPAEELHNFYLVS